MRGENMEQEISYYPKDHPAYPDRLRTIPDAPAGLYVKGSLPQAGKSLAIVGARDCSEYGRYVAGAFAEEAARAGIQIISGMARGIDSEAQKAALNAGGKSFAVLGCGVDICYPPSQRDLYETLCSRCGVLSPYAPGSPPLARQFPPRNRIISGLADAILVVEARQKSGTLITVDMALEQGKEVYVVPGRITDRLSDSCNRLLAQGAAPALSPAQLVSELMETLWKEAEPSKKEENPEKEAGLTDTQQALLRLLDLELCSLEQLRTRMRGHEILENLSLQETMEMLVRLSVTGAVRTQGGYYGLTSPISNLTIEKNEKIPYNGK